MASRLFMISQIGSTFVAVTLDFKPDIAVITQQMSDMHKINSLVFYIDVNRLYS
jgi:hypothetical protein